MEVDATTANILIGWLYGIYTLLLVAKLLFYPVFITNPCRISRLLGRFSTVMKNALIEQITQIMTKTHGITTSIDILMTGTTVTLVG
jgi:hypothetical protein